MPEDVKAKPKAKKVSNPKSITIAELIEKIKAGANRQFIVEKLGEYV